MTTGQLILNKESGRLGIVKHLLDSGLAVVTRCNDQGVPAADSYKTLWGTRNGPGIWITPLDKWEPVVIHGPAEKSCT